MDEKEFTYKSSHRFQVLPPCTLDLDYFKKLYGELNKITEDGGNIEISQLKKQKEETEENFENFKNEARKLYKASIHIHGDGGQYFYWENSSIFDDPGLPNKIVKIAFDNTSKFKALLKQKEPINKFRIEFDFTKQGVFDFVTIPSEATPNRSFISVLGENETWVVGTYNKVIEFLSDYRNKHGWLHRRSIYDMFLWFLIIPVSFRVLYHVNRSLPENFVQLSDFFKVACYLYFFIIILYVFRIVFNYARWVFPNIELIRPLQSCAIKHRVFLGTILISIIAALIYDIIKSLI